MLTRMPHAGELPEGWDVSPLPTTAGVPIRRREPGDAAMEALWQLYARAQGLELANPATCRPDPATMGAVLFVHAKEERRKLVALAAAATTLADVARQVWATSAALEGAIGQVRQLLADITPRFPGYPSGVGSTSSVGSPE